MSVSKKTTIVSMGVILSSTSLLAAPEFSPQFRWGQEGITVADNHAKSNTVNNETSSENAPQENKQDNAMPVEIQDSKQENTTDDSIDKTIETLETGIQIDDIIEPPASYRYSSFSKRDPFSYPDREEMDDDSFVVSKLQHHDISSLKLVGVWRLSTGVSKALILTPKGEGVVAVIGDPVGQNNGEIMEIGKNKIIIREYLMTPDGTRQFNDIDMFLEDYFDTGTSAATGLETISDEETSLEEELNKLLNSNKQAVQDVMQGANTPANMPAGMPNMPTMGGVPVGAGINTPASGNPPAQPQGSP